MNKILILLLVLLLLGITGTSLMNFYTQKEILYEYTRAICSGNECQDFLITCNNKNFVKMTPVSGRVVFRENWVDKRKDEGLCV